MNASRRAFLQGVGQLSVLGAAAPMALGLSAATTLANAADSIDDYKALVCIFLYGGNDHYNTIIPYDETTYNKYAVNRNGVAIPRDTLASTILAPANAFDNSRSMALNSNLSGLNNLFNADKLAIAMNIGTLLNPTTKSDYENGVGLPPKLMSHNDQFSLWQSLSAEGAKTGWGGRLGDIFAGNNGDAQDLLTNITVGASAVFSNGVSSEEFAIGASGPVNIAQNYLGAQTASATSTLMDMQIADSMDAEHLMKRELARRFERVKSGNSLLNNGLGTQGSFSEMPETNLGKQLDMVARIIASRDNTGAKRQIFFVGMGGFDSHGSLNTDHPALLTELNDAMVNFQSVIDNKIGLSENVTTFTASDFGRSLTTNGRGSDHGWGGHHFIMGGAVKPKHWFGALPTYELGAAGTDDVGQGRLLPSASVDQYGATLASWMGVSASDLQDIFPNLVNFNDTNLGFMKT